MYVNQMSHQCVQGEEVQSCREIAFSSAVDPLDFTNAHTLEVLPPSGSDSLNSA